MTLGGRNCPYCRYYTAVDEPHCGRCGRWLPPGPLAALVHEASRVQHPATKALCALSIVVFALQLAVAGGLGGGLFTGMPVWVAARFGGLLGDDGLTEPYRLLAACFVHYGVLHIVFNVMALADLGRALETRFGPARTVLAYVITGVFGFLVSTWWYAPALVPTAGASGAAFGFVGVLLGDRLARRDPGFRQALVRTVLYSVVWYFVLRTNQAAHLGGLAAGMGLGVLFAKESRPWRIARAVNIAAGVCLALCVVSLVLPHFSPEWRVLRSLEEQRRARRGHAASALDE